MNIVVCVLFYEKVEQTIECLKSFAPADVPIYVLNNHSSQPSREKLEEFVRSHAGIRVIDADRNLGVGLGRNRLIEETSEGWLFFIDNDITVQTIDWKDRLANALERYPDSEVFVPRLYNIHDRGYSNSLIFSLKEGTAYFDTLTGSVSNLFPGGAAIIHRSLFKRLGLYDKKMFVGLEDFELALRGILAGKPCRVRHLHDIKLVHDHRPALDREDVQAVAARYDIPSIENSFQRIREKHGINVENDWKRWVAEQVAKMTSGEDAAAQAGTVRTPAQCSLFLTDRCNFACRGCSRNVIGLPESKEMTVALVRKLLDSYPSISGVCIAGLGEPTLCADFGEIVNLLKSSGKYVGVITNGSNPGPLLALTSRPDYISISLYGYDAESYMAYCGVDAFAIAMDTFRKLREQAYNVGFSYFIHHENVDTLPRILSLCDSLKPDFLNLVNYLPYDSCLRSERERLITSADTDIIARVNALIQGKIYIKARPIYPNLAVPGQGCTSYSTIINLDGSGSIGGCQRQLPPNPKFGSLLTSDDPYNSPVMRRFRDLQAQGCHPHMECRYCFGNWSPPEIEEQRRSFLGSSKPLVAIVADTNGWAYSNIAIQLAKRLSHKFDFSVLYIRQFENWRALYSHLFCPQKYDLVHFLWRVSVCNGDILKPRLFVPEDQIAAYKQGFVNTVLTGSVYDHMFLEEKETTWRGPFLRYILQALTVSSNRLLDIYSHLPDYPTPDRVISDGVDINLFYPKNLERFQDPNRLLVVGWVGNSRWIMEDGMDRKGFCTIVQPAMEQLVAEGESLVLHAADRHERMIPLHAMVDYYASIDVLICSSLHEGTPNPVLEAMACGVPIISTDVGVIPDLFGTRQKKFIIQRSIESVKEALREIRHHPELLQALSEENLRAIQNWTRDEESRRWLLFFQEALARGRTPEAKRTKKLLLDDAWGYANLR